MSEETLRVAYEKRLRAVDQARRALVREEREIGLRLADLKLDVAEVIRLSLERVDSTLPAFLPLETFSSSTSPPIAALHQPRSPVGTWTKSPSAPSPVRGAPSPPNTLLLQSPPSPLRPHSNARTPLEDLAMLGPENDAPISFADSGTFSLASLLPPSPPASAPPPTPPAAEPSAQRRVHISRRGSVTIGGFTAARAPAPSPPPARGEEALFAAAASAPQDLPWDALRAEEALVAASEPWDDLLSNSELTRTQFALYLPCQAFNALTDAERDAIQLHLGAIAEQEAPANVNLAAVAEVNRTRAEAKLAALRQA